MTEPKKPRGYFKYLLGMDCETSGIYFSSDDPLYNEADGKYFQPISWGFLVIDADTLDVVEKLYVEIKWDGIAEWSPQAQAVHGLSKDHLDQHGIPEEDAMLQIANLIVKYWGTSPVCTLGHNVHTFDMPALRRQMRRHGIELNFGNRHVDTNSAGFLSFKTYNSDDLFECAGMPERKLHNAMEDIEYTLESAKRIQMIFDMALS